MRKSLWIIFFSVFAGMLFCACSNKQSEIEMQSRIMEVEKPAEAEINQTPKKEVEIEEEKAAKETAWIANMPDFKNEGTDTEDLVVEEAVAVEETLGNPRSSYGLGSASYLKGRNLLVSLFVTTPESTWSDTEQQKMLAKIEKAAEYIKKQAQAYGIETSLLYDFNAFPDLKAEAETEFLINEENDFIDRLDKEIVLWQEEKLFYEELLAKYEADGIATMIFVNNPGISYAIVYDGTDSQKETMILFTEDYYQEGKEESATAYAHEILHVFGAHDLYEDAEFTREVSDYVSKVYPREIMYTVVQTGEEIDSVLSPITAYHLGWIDEAEEVQMFPQLVRK